MFISMIKLSLLPKCAILKFNIHHMVILAIPIAQLPTVPIWLGHSRYWGFLLCPAWRTNLSNSCLNKHWNCMNTIINIMLTNISSNGRNFWLVFVQVNVKAFSPTDWRRNKLKTNNEWSIRYCTKYFLLYTITLVHNIKVICCHLDANNSQCQKDER